MKEVTMGIGTVKVGKEISFTLSMNATKEAAEHLPFLADAVRFGSVKVSIESLQIPLPEQPPLPLDGDIPGDPFPAWERLFEAAEVPVCNCPGPDEEGALAWPIVTWASVEDGITAIVYHRPPCTLGANLVEADRPDSPEGERQTTISSLDFTEMEDFHRALAKARGRKEIVDLPFGAEEDDGDEAE